MKEFVEKIKVFLETVAGVDKIIIRREECKGERQIYQAIGINISITATFAFISASYAMNSIFKSLSIALALGCFWGFSIAMIDRFLIMTTDKKNSFSWEQVSIATTRILMAALIAMVISKPLEMALFSKEILAGIAQANLMAEVQMQKTVAQLPESLEIDRLRKVNQDLQAQDTELDKKLDKAYQAMICEAEGTCGTTKMGKGPVYDKKLEELNRQKQVLATTTAQHQVQIKANNRQIEGLEKAKAAKVNQVQSARMAADSILAQMQMLHKMAEKDATVAWASFLISAIFVSIDVMPILGKLLMKRTAHDAIKQRKTASVILHEDAMTENQKFEVARKIRQHNEVQAQIERISGQALNDAVNAALGSRLWARTTAKAARSLMLRMSAELMKAIGQVPLPKSAINKAAREAMEQEIPDLAKHQARSRIYRQRVSNGADDIVAEAQRAVDEFTNRQDD